VNGAHDMGGVRGFGAVYVEPDEPLFHAPWEKRALALTLAMGATGQWNIDMSRHARESLPKATYLASSYYRIWLLALEQLLLERGLVQAQELQSGHMTTPAKTVARVLHAGDVAPALARGSATLRQASAGPRFSVGERVRAVPASTPGHTRLPRYVHGHTGVVQHVHGAHVFADSHAKRTASSAFDEDPQWLYTVVFEARELWGTKADASSQVSVDAWEPYLQTASAAA
jgi:nitrile hydratase subunit beta